MTVSELIEKLKQLDGELDVVCTYSFYNGSQWEYDEVCIDSAYECSSLIQDKKVAMLE